MINTLKTLIRKIKGRERKVRYGNENPDKTFYIIGQNDGIGGLFWIIHKVLMHIGYAIDCGYIPVVDMQNYYSQYLEKHLRYKENAWEYWFEQPMGEWNLSKIKKSKNIIICKKMPSPKQEYFMGNFYYEPDRITYFRNLFKRFIIFNNNTKDYLSSEYEKILKGKGSVLGVLCRGTDYMLNKPTGHPIQPDPFDVIKKAEEIMNEKQCLYIYLATEDQDIYEYFRGYFKEKLLANNQKRVSRDDMKDAQWVSKINMKNKRERNAYQLDLEYLSSIYLLSKCTYFIGGRTGGTKGVLLMTEGFEYEYIYDLGYYP